MKDRDDPDDGSEATIELQLTDQWQTYKIDLASFATADLSTVYVVLKFLFFHEAQPFSIRTVKYLDNSD